MEEIERISELSEKFALLNAIEHSGKAEVSAVVGRILSESIDLRKKAQLVKSIASSKVSEINQLDVETQKKRIQDKFSGELEKLATRKREASREEASHEYTLPDLPGARIGQFVSRFPPEPNGYMHIGHAKAAIIGHEYSKKYNGQFLIRFDDTNPAAEKIEFYSAFLDSLSWVGINTEKVKNASDDILIFYKFAEKLLKFSKGYMCTCSQEAMRKNRAAGVSCSHRSQEVPENLKLWEAMLSGSMKEGSVTLRLVGDMSSVNTTMRDPVLFRIVEEPHPLKGTEFRVWPTYDFDGAVEDSLDGVTHAFRSKEYELRDEPYRAILDALDLRKPAIVEFSRLSLQNTTVSKRNLKKLIEEGVVEGWDDPRLPTIAGLRRRGFLPESIREFILSMGVSKVESQPTWDLLESINRKLLDPIAKRFFFVGDPVELEVDSAPAKSVKLKFHPEKDLGEREVTTNGRFFLSHVDALGLREGTRFRLIEAYNVEVISLGDKIKAKYLPEENIEGIKKLQWVTPGNAIPFSVTVTGPLLKGDEYNPDSIKVVKGLIETSGQNLKQGEIFQLVRFGFCRLDSAGSAIMTHK